MGILKYIVIGVIIAAIGGSYYLYTYKPELIPPVIAQHTPTFESKASELQTQIYDLKDNRIAPLGKSIDQSQIFQVDESNVKPMHQKAFEYGRYEYCKQVIRDYEKEQE